MQHHATLAGDQLTVTIDGRITHQDHDGFRNLIETVKSSILKRTILDLARAEFIDSAGLGMLLLLRDAAADRGIEVVLAGAQGQVQRLFESSKFGSLFTMKG